MLIILPLVITLALETGIYMILKHRDLKLFLVVSGLNIVLNPLMNVCLFALRGSGIYWLSVSTFEILTVLIESLIIFLIMKIKFPKVLLFSFLANALSFGVGISLSFVYQMKITPIIVGALFLSIYIFTFIFTTLCYINDYKNSKSSKENC